MSNVTVTRMSTDELKKQEWRFYVSTSWGSDNIFLVLDHYDYSTRPTRRHKWIVVDSFYRLELRTSNIKDVNLVPLPLGVEKEAIEKLNPRVVREMPQ